MAQAVFNSAVKTRVPADMKEKIQELAKGRQLDESDIVREALREFLTKTPASVTNPRRKR